MANFYYGLPPEFGLALHIGCGTGPAHATANPSKWDTNGQYCRRLGTGAFAGGRVSPHPWQLMIIRQSVEDPDAQRGQCDVKPRRRASLDRLAWALSADTRALPRHWEDLPICDGEIFPPMELPKRPPAKGDIPTILRIFIRCHQ
jgi:hypothetical protein